MEGLGILGRLAAFGLVLLLGVGSVSGQEIKPRLQAPEGPLWSTLTSSQRTELAPLKEDWSSIDAARKQKWLQVAGKMAAMPPPERERIRERMAAWARLTPAERGRARAQFLEAQNLAPDDRLSRWEAYQALPEAQRKALAQRAAAASSASSPPARQGDTSLTPFADRRQIAPPAPKRNLLEMPARAAVKPVAPTVVQAKPGATTTLVSRPAKPPAHQQPGRPKIATAPDAVDRSTLLPLKTPQAPASSPSPEPSPSGSDPSTEP